MIRSATIPEHKNDHSKYWGKICQTVPCWPESLHLRVAHVSRLQIFYQGSSSYSWLHNPGHSSQLYEEHVCNRAAQAASVLTVTGAETPCWGHGWQWDGEAASSVISPSPTQGEELCWHSGSPEQTRRRGNRSLQLFKLVLKAVSKDCTHPQPRRQSNKLGVCSSPTLQVLWDG